ncbi:hypothetical protein N9181_01030 [bacterium]|nr:hypothetical protein [bacterium]
MIKNRIPDNAPQKQLRPRNVFEVANVASCLAEIEMAVVFVNVRVSWNDTNNKHVKENRNRNTPKSMLRCGLGKFGSIVGFSLWIQKAGAGDERWVVSGRGSAFRQSLFNWNREYVHK